MLADEFSKVGSNPYNIDSLPSSKAVKTAVETLCSKFDYDVFCSVYEPSLRTVIRAQADRNVFRIIYAPATEWGNVELPDYVGAWLVELQDGEPCEFSYKKVAKIHGKTIGYLFKSGVIEVDRDLIKPHRRVTIFKMTDDAIFDDRGRYIHFNIQKTSRMSRELLNEIASRNAFSVNYNVNHSRFRFVDLKSDKETVYPLFCTKDSKTEIINLNSLTPVQWEEEIHSLRQDILLKDRKNRLE